MLDGVFVPQGGAISPGHGQTVPPLDNADSQIVFGPCRGVAGSFILRRRDIAVSLLLIHKIEHHIEQGIAGGIASDGKTVHQLFEGIFLVFVIRQGVESHLRHKLMEGFFCGGEMSEGQGVDKHADDPFQVGVTAAGYRRPDYNILLPRQFGQQKVQQCQERHEQCGAALPGQLPDNRGLGFVQHKADTLAGETLGYRPPLVQGQVEHRDLSLKTVHPVVPLPLQCCFPHIRRQPVGVVPIVQSKGRQGFPPVQLSELSLQQLLGGAVGYDVMHVQ